MRLSQLAKEINFEFNGEDREIISMQTIEYAKEGDLSFVEDKKYSNLLKNSKASALFIREELKELVPKNSIAIVSKNPRVMMAKATKFFEYRDFERELEKPKIGEGSFIHEKATILNGSIIGKNVKIYPNVFIGENVKIGDNTIIYPNNSIYSNSIIGKNCIIHSGSVIGSDGFGFVPDGKKIVKIYHLGNVAIEDEVEIGANVTIDRGVFGSTLIKKGTKIDNLVHFGHNVQVGENCLFVAQTGISGSTKIGNFVTMGGQSGTVGHIEIGDFSTIAARGGVTKSLKGNNTYSGFPIKLHKEWLKLQAKLSKLLKG